MKKFMGVSVILLIAVLSINLAVAGVAPLTDDSGRDNSSINDSSE